jgi:hypothetical protein
VQHVVIEVLGTGACSELYVGINGAAGLIYEGPIFLDNLVIYSEEYAD